MDFVAMKPGEQNKTVGGQRLNPNWESLWIPCIQVWLSLDLNTDVSSVDLEIQHSFCPGMDFY